MKILSNVDIPLVIHTYYFRSNLSAIEKLYNANSPLNWIKLLEKNQIRGYLAHGCRLSYECYDILKQNKGQFLVGIAPDLLLSNEQNRLVHDTDNYLLDILSKCDTDFLAFDIDYNWNYTDRTTFTYDDNQLNRFYENVKDEQVRKKY